MQNFQSGHVHFVYFIIVHIVGLLAKTCTPWLLGKASSGTWVVCLAGGQLPLPPNSLLWPEYTLALVKVISCPAIFIMLAPSTAESYSFAICSTTLLADYDLATACHQRYITPSWCYALLFSCYVVLRWQHYITPPMLCFASICFFMQYVPLTTLDHS